MVLLIRCLGGHLFVSWSFYPLSGQRSLNKALHFCVFSNLPVRAECLRLGTRHGLPGRGEWACHFRLPIVTFLGYMNKH